MKPKTTGKEMEEQLLQLKLDSESVTAIAADPRSTIYSWRVTVREAKEEEVHEKGEKLALDPRSYYKQKECIEKLREMIEVLKAVFYVLEIPLDKQLKALEGFYAEKKSMSG